MPNELFDLEEIVKPLPASNTITFDMRLTNKHWLVNYEYFFVRKDIPVQILELNTGLYSHYKHDHRWNMLSPYEFLNAFFEESIKRYWSDKIKVGKVFLLAWSKYTVEKDTGLCYIYDSDGYYKGIYCHCMNRVEEFIYIGQSINGFFSLEKTKQRVLEVQEGDVAAVKKKLSRAQLMTYDKLLNPEEYKILDSEIGFRVTLDLYEKLIKGFFIPLSNNELAYSKLELLESSEYLDFRWCVNDNWFDVRLDNKSDYIDFTIYKVLNEVVTYLGFKRQFVIFKDTNFGQEYGLAYVDTAKKRKLGNLTTIELLEP